VTRPELEGAEYARSARFIGLNDCQTGVGFLVVGAGGSRILLELDRIQLVTLGDEIDRQLSNEELK